MATHSYYSKYKKVKQQKITDLAIIPRIESLLKDGDNLSDEETCLFLKSLKSFYIDHSALSIKQFNALQSIENKVSERASAQHDKWIKQYDDNKRKVATICAHYYKSNPPYYSSLVKNVLEDPTFIPTESQYRSMCENKYALKVLEATFTEPLFTSGELAQGRVNAAKPIRNKLVTVVQFNHRPVVHAAKGAKTYLVLPIGSEAPFECEERHLKKFTKST